MWSLDRGEDEDPVARQCRPPVEKVVAGRRNRLSSPISWSRIPFSSPNEEVSEVLSVREP